MLYLIVRWAVRPAVDTAADRTGRRVIGALGSLGIVLFAFTVLFQLVTLPVEIDASRRALAAIERGLAGAALAELANAALIRELADIARRVAVALARVRVGHALVRALAVFGGGRLQVHAREA